MAEISSELKDAELFFGKMVVKITWINPAIKGEILIDISSKVTRIELWREMLTEKIKFEDNTHYIKRIGENIFRVTPAWQTQLN